MTINGFWWFVAALVILGAHALYMLDWQRESRARLKAWADYDAASQKRHDEFMASIAKVVRR